MKTVLAPLSASHDNVLEGGSSTSGRIVARLAECPSSMHNSRTSVATVEEYRRGISTSTNPSTSSPIKPIRNRRKSGNSSSKTGNSESIPLLVQSRATVHHQISNHHNHNHQAAPKGNVDEVNDQLTPRTPPPSLPPPCGEIPGHDELHANIAPPAYITTTKTLHNTPLLDSQQFLSPSALFKSSNCVGSAPSSGSSTAGGGTGGGSKGSPTSTITSTSKKPNQHRTNTSNAFHRYDFIQCTKL